MNDLERPSDFRGIFRVDDDARAVYSEAAGIGRIVPRAVAVPADADDVASLARWAGGAGTFLVPRGSGSSMAGGAIGAGVIVDLSRLDTIEPVDVTRRTIRCGPGAVHARADAAARETGLRIPVDPSSSAFCTIGGMVSTNAAGAHSLRFGAMRPWVEALECVFADGSRAELRRGHPAPAVAPVGRFLGEASVLAHAELATPAIHRGVLKESSGYGLAAFIASGELVDLMVGSEGTLAIVVGIELRLAPVPLATASLLGAFGTLEDAVSAAVRARESGASACELLDRTFLDVAREGGARVPVSSDAEAVLLAEVEGERAGDVATQAGRLEASFRASGATSVATALGEEAEHDLWTLRHAVSPILGRLGQALRSMQFIEDGCVPPEHLAEYVRGVRAALERQRIRGVIFGHAGDAHVHVNPLVPVTEPDWRERVEGLLAEVTSLAARLGGTLAGEHGDGRLRTPLLSQMWPAEVLDRFATVKRAFDPGGVLNPGVTVAHPGGRAVDEVKYDPASAPLPRRARIALARVEAERAYSSFRLALLDEADVGSDSARDRPPAPPLLD